VLQAVRAGEGEDVAKSAKLKQRPKPTTVLQVERAEEGVDEAISSTRAQTSSADGLLRKKYETKNWKVMQ
jgi:hypothetical protein